MSQQPEPSEAPVSHADRKVRARTLEADRSNLAVARRILQARWALLAEGPRELSPSAESVRRRSQKWIEPMGWLHRPESPSTRSASANTAEEGSHVQLTPPTARPTGSEAPALVRPSRTDRVPAP